MENEKKYYQTYLEVSLIKSDYLFGVINLSNIPYEIFEEIFKDQVTRERYLFDECIAYTIDEDLYLKNKRYLDKNVPFTFDFKLFDYSVSLLGNKFSKIPRFYYDELPRPFI